MHAFGRIAELSSYVFFFVHLVIKSLKIKPKLRNWSVNLNFKWSSKSAQQALGEKHGVKNTSSQTSWWVKDITRAVMHSWLNLFTVEIPAWEHTYMSLETLKEDHKPKPKHIQHLRKNNWRWVTVMQKKYIKKKTSPYRTLSIPVLFWNILSNPHSKHLHPNQSKMHNKAYRSLLKKQQNWEHPKSEEEKQAKLKTV